jgi:hypothetical protein
MVGAVTDGIHDGEHNGHRTEMVIMRAAIEAGNVYCGCRCVLPAESGFPAATDWVTGGVTDGRSYHGRSLRMFILGVVLLLLGWLLGINILTTLGIILIVVGAVLFVLGSVNRPVLGRRYWY